MKYVFAVVRICMCVALLALTTACTKKVNWSEDVQLADGRVVTLTRHQEFGGPHEIGQRPTESVGWLEFEHPDSGRKIRWEFTRDLAPVALIIDRDATRLLVVPEYGGLFRYKCPSPPYLLYQYREQGWVEVSIAELRGTKVKRNMITSPVEAKELMKTDDLHLDVDQTMQSAIGYTEGRRIDFGKLTTQSFGMKGCDPPFDWLIEDEGK